MDTKLTTTAATQKMRPLTTKRVGVLGTGQFALAFARRLLTAGYSVTLGSRHPQQHRHHHHHHQHHHHHLHALLLGSSGNDKDAARDSAPESDSESAGDDVIVTVTSQEDCVTGNDVIVVALHAEHFQTTFSETASGLGGLCAGKVLVDVSNRRARGWRDPKPPPAGHPPRSNAELLASLAPEASVVKAFNSVSAYVMENDVAARGGGGTRRVEVASDDAAARAVVCALARGLGFEPRESGAWGGGGGGGGGLGKAAWRMEESVLTLLPDWRVAGAVTLLLLLFWLLFAVSR